MKITPNLNPPPPTVVPELRRKKSAQRKQSRRKRTGPPTPLLQWKFNLAGRDSVSNVEEFGARKVRRGANGGGTVSVRKLAAALWRLQPPEVGNGVRQERCDLRKEDDRLGFKRGTSHVGEMISSHHGSRDFGFDSKGQPRSPCSVNGPVNGYACEPQASFKFTNYAMEGATKWDPVEEPKKSQLFDKKQNAVEVVSALQAELEQAQRRIEELESEKRSSKKKLKQFLHKLSEDRTAWRSREHEKVRAIINDVKSDLSRERKNSQRLEMINSKLVNDLAESKSVMKRYMQDFEKERKNRELMEEVCDELAKEMDEDKAEVEELKAECMKIREEVDDERKMLQMAEVWREERVQMKLVDAKVTLEDKYSQMNSLVEYLQQFLSSKSADLDIRDIKEAEFLHQAASSIQIQDLKEFTYEPPKSDDIFSIFEEMGMGMGETTYGSQNNDDLNDDASGWETVSQASGSATSPNKEVERDSNVSGSGTEWEGNRGDETPMTETSEVCSFGSKHVKKRSSISRLWRSHPNNGDSYKIISVDGSNGRLSNGRISNAGSVMSPDESGNPHIGKGIKGCIEWPRGQKQSMKSKLMEARVENHKVQLRQVLKQKI